MDEETKLYADLVYINQAIDIYHCRMVDAQKLHDEFADELTYQNYNRYYLIVKTLSKRRRVLEKRLLSQFVEGYEE